MKEKLFELFGFRDQPARWWAWAIVILAVAFGVSLFFVSYSLARHKAMLADYKVQVIALKAELNVAKLEAERKAEELKLERLKAEGKANAEERKRIEGRIADLGKGVDQAKKDLEEKRRKAKGEGLDALMKRAETLRRSTL